MQYPNHALYKFFEDDINNIFSAYIKQFVEANNQLIDTKEKTRFLSLPFDISKLHAFKEYTSVLKAYEQYDILKTFHLECSLGNLANTNSLSLDFVLSPISHVVLEPRCAPTISKLQVDQEGYRDHLLRSRVAEVAYCVGKQFRGFFRGVYLLGKILSNRKLEYLMAKNSHKYGVCVFKDFLKQFNDILNEGERSMIKEVEDHPKAIRHFLKQWDMCLLDTIGSEKIQTNLSAAGLTLKNWLTR